MLSLVLIKTRNAPIQTMKIRQIQQKTGFRNTTPWEIRCNLNPKAQAVNKAQRQLRPESYFLEYFKSGIFEQEIIYLINRKFTNIKLKSTNKYRKIRNSYLFLNV